MTNKELLLKVIDNLVENGGTLNTDEENKFNEEKALEWWFGPWQKRIKGHLEADSKYFYTYHDGFLAEEADVVLKDGNSTVYLFLIGKN